MPAAFSSPESRTVNDGIHYSLDGTVKDTDGRPVRSAIIHISRRNERETTTSTDDAGHYSIKLPAGDYSVVAERPGFVTLEFGQSGPFDVSTPIRLGAGIEMATADFALPHGGAIAGHVTDDLGMPVANALVAVHDKEFDRGFPRLVQYVRVAPVRTDERGYFRLSSVPSSDWYLSVTLGGAFHTATGSTRAYAYPQTFFPSSTTAEGAQTITVAPDSEKKADLTLRRAALVEVVGAVRDSRGRLATDGVVRWYQRNTLAAPPKVAAIGKDGRFAIEILDLPGDFVLAAQTGAPGRGEDGEFARREFHLPDQLGTIAKVELRSAMGTPLPGRVEFRESSGGTPQSAAVHCLPENREDAWLGPRHSAVRPSGDFSLPNVHVPCVILVDSAPPNQLSTIFVRAGTVDINRKAIDPARRSPISIQVTQAPSRVAGVVAGMPPGHAATVVAASSDRSTWTDPGGRYVTAARVSKEGRFEVAGLPGGDYFAVALTTLDRRTLTEPAFLESLAKRGAHFSVSPGRASQLALVISQDQK